MISLIEASNFRSLRYISQPLGPFHILVGPNASGKTTFLDVIAFLNQLALNGLEVAVNEWARNFKDLLWRGEGNSFELAIEAILPTSIATKFDQSSKSFDTIRYEIAIGIDKASSQLAILEEQVILKPAKDIHIPQHILFPDPSINALPVITKKDKTSLTVIKKTRNGRHYFQTETAKNQAKNWTFAFKFGPQKLLLTYLPDDELMFPATLWLRDLLTTGVQSFVLNSLLIRKASPPSYRPGFRPDGSNLPWVIEGLRQKDPQKFADWIAHLQTALPDIENIRTVEREDDRHRYLLVKYKGGLEIPSWMVSDGTLRLLALTLPAYLPDLKGIYLIEEPENGIHPSAVETVFQSLSSVYDAQILLATHSPVILGIAKAEQVLCFAKAENGATDIVAGDQHPALRDWKGEVNLGVLFASGVLG